MVRDEAGSIGLLVAAIPVVAGVVAVGAETGSFYRLKRQMQNAADDAALSGSIDRINGLSTSTIANDALYEARRNGFANGASNVTVTVNSPPTSGNFINANGAVEVIIQKSSQSFVFGTVLNAFLGKASSTFTVTARSVAAQAASTSSTQTATSTNKGCLVALTPLAEQGVYFSSFNNFTSDCALVSNGVATGRESNASIYMTSFNSGSFQQIWTRGSFTAESYGSLTPLPSNAQTMQTGTVVDPYASLATPSPGTCTYTNFSYPSGTSVTLTPGTYCGGLSIRGGVNNVYFSPGTYYVANGDLYITSVNNVSCPTCVDGQTGVTFVLTQTTGNYSNIGGVYISSENNVTLSAPPQSSGQPFPGVLFYQDRNAPIGTMTSTSKIFTVTSLNNAKLSGAVYFPNNRIDISSLNNAGNSTNGCTVWVGRYLKFTSYNNNYVAGCGTFSTKWATMQTTATTTIAGKAKICE
ncbi:pilus assembly protein TadG-related protein [Enhydrobacter aerosaccus]|uniref:pilus assembly protein TadG-related protein n=1 Tax=Enhydrobacter aerosaccus TaxID=225324 RepID=UPI001483B980|nr:pilus assembly protein TadG-related protein [Enhydrobacter aerosaccus]